MASAKCPSCGGLALPSRAQEGALACTRCPWASYDDEPLDAESAKLLANVLDRTEGER
jgi:hypothetical protein